ncbi:MAG TPA: RDD family protein [Candidatus Acidoferrales bacterium]|nr:RDD family protein [Candidatus Acidoferrales bacterium]
MERSVDVDTGESVVFSYELAGLGSRFLAVFVDLTLQTVAALLLFLTAALLVGALSKLGAVVHGLPYAVLAAIVIFAAFLLFFGYFIIFEWYWQGQTPGKRLVGIRTVRDGGFPLDFTSSVIRNVVRILEASLGFYAISALSTLLSPQNKRIGDYAAGTIVVRDRRFESLALFARKERQTNDPGTRDLPPQERELVRRYASRRAALTPRARGELAAAIGARVRPHLAARFDHLDDDALLVHLAESVL